MEADIFLMIAGIGIVTVVVCIIASVHDVAAPPPLEPPPIAGNLRYL